jgi:O-antigen/teichoic acid export membrane protein
LVLFLLLLFTALFPYLALLQPLGQTMLAVKWNLCAGTQQFVVAKLLGERGPR